MNIVSDGHSWDVEARCRANDAFRRALPNGTIALSAGIAALGSTALDAIIAAIRDLDFDTDDESDAHDIGDIEILVVDLGGQLVRQLVFFRIDGVTGTVSASPRLAVLLASEWWSGAASSSESVLP